MITRCSLCPMVNVPIPPDGPEHADILFIGEAPGKDEDLQARKFAPGRPFIGKTGEEVDRHYLPLAGLRRPSVMFHNAICCLPASTGGKLDPTSKKDRALLEACASHSLYPLIERMQPKLLVPLGSFACRAVCPDVHLELGHGIPTQTPWGIPAFPMYHPALGIHEPKKMLYIRTDWHRLRGYLDGSLLLPTDDYPEPDYQEVTHVEELELDPTLPLAGDTESTRRREPYCLTYSQHPGSGRLIRASRRDLLTEFQHRLEHWESEILFHNWLYDEPVTIAMGLRFPHKLMVDTMARVFHLGNLPQGLKALALRELGMTMEDFEDVVTPYSTERVMDYYRMAAQQDWPKPEEQVVIDEKTGLWKLYKPQGMNTKFKRFFTDCRKNPEKDIFSIWDAWPQQQIEAVCGEWPGLCISHVPFEKTLFYACRDADATLRLWPILQKMARVVRRLSQENWRTA